MLLKHVTFGFRGLPVFVGSQAVGQSRRVWSPDSPQLGP